MTTTGLPTSKHLSISNASAHSSLMLRNPTTISLQLPRLPLLPLLLSLQASHPLFNELLLPRLVFASFVVVMMRKTIWFNRISTWVSKNARTTMTVGATDRGPEHRYRVKHSFILCGHRSADELASGSCQATCRLEDRSVHRTPCWKPAKLPEPLIQYWLL
jgi:hypothetical protein